MTSPLNPSFFDDRSTGDRSKEGSHLILDGARGNSAFSTGPTFLKQGSAISNSTGGRLHPIKLGLAQPLAQIEEPIIIPRASFRPMVIRDGSSSQLSAHFGSKSSLLRSDSKERPVIKIVKS